MDYNALVNKSGTIYNIHSGMGYNSPQQLAGDLGVNANAIQWGQIVRNDAYSPIVTPTTIPQSTATPPQPGQSASPSVQPPSTSSSPQGQNQPPPPPAQPLQQPSQPPIQNAIGTRQIPGQQQTEYFNAQTGQGFSTPQALSSYLNTQYNAQTNAQNVFEYLNKAFQQTKGTAPDTQGEAQAQIQKTLDSQNAGSSDIFKTSQIDAQLQSNPAYQQLLADKAQYDSLANQNQSLVQTYQQMSQQLGIPALNTELMNMKNVIDGTEQDIRTEVTKAGGFATDSQVMALSNARNKQLIKNYNNLLGVKQQAMDTLNNMTSLASQDRQFAMSSLNQKMQIDKQILDYQQKMQDNARQAYQDVLSQVGYAGLQQMTGGDPYYTNLVEKTLGLSSGGLAQLAAYKKPLTAMEQADLALKQAQVSQIPLENKLKQAQIANIYSEIKKRSEPTKIETQVVDMGGGRKVVINSQTGAIISEVGANPIDQGVKALISSSASWGEAADKINKAFNNPNAATQYDSQLKAYFQQGKDINTAFTIATPQMQMQQATQKAQIDQITSLITDKGLNSSVGPNYLARFSIANQLTGAKANFIAGIEQIRSQLNLQSLIDAKSKGATFGALSDQELQVLANSATKIGAWAIKDSNGQVTGYKANETDFRKELDKINNFAKLDYIKKGGNPEDVGVQVMPDGTHWTRNSDGTMTQL